MISIKDLNIRDPFVFKEDGVYYLFASNHYEGDKYPCFICYTSNDFVNFNEPTIVFKGFDGFWGTKDYWAPEMHKYNDKYYLFVSMKAENKCRATQILVCDTPNGSYVPLTDKPQTPSEWESLDGTLYIENGVPYMVFCHEWLQVDDGEICAIQLTNDLKNSVGDPILLFKASELNWVKPIVNENYITKSNSYVTDGPFLFKRNNKLCMTWSTYCEEGYSVVLSTSDSLLSKWSHSNKPLFSYDGGHGMILEENGVKKLIIHVPNEPNGDERIGIFDLENLISEMEK